MQVKMLIYSSQLWTLNASEHVDLHFTIVYLESKLTMNVVVKYKAVITVANIPTPATQKKGMSVVDKTTDVFTDFKKK